MNLACLRPLLLGLLLLSGSVAADLCSQIFPAATTPTSGYQLDLAAVMDGQTYGNFPNSGASFTTAGSWYYTNGTLGTWNAIYVKTGATTFLFFDGDLVLQPQSSINPYLPSKNSGGRPQDLIIIVRGNLTIGTKNSINALIYASGNIDANPQSAVVGAMTAGGSINLDSGASVTYDAAAAATFNLPGACSDGSTPVDHYQLSYSSTALTCQPQTITVTACANAACSSTYTGGSSQLSLQPAGTALTFTGSTSTPLAVRSASTVTLSVSGTNPAPLAALKCRIDGGAASTSCPLTFADSGLLVSAPDVIAARPDTLSISAVRKSDNSLLCVPAFASVSRSVQLWQTWLDPDAATQVGNLRVQAGGTAVGSAATPSSHTLNFNASGVASLPMSYADAGQMQLDARYTGSVANGDSGLVMTGSDTFVSRPYGLHLGTAASCSSATVAGCSVLAAAGDNFGLTVRPVAWQADGEVQTAAALADNATTPNFRLSGIALDSSVQAPAAGNAGSLSLSSYDHALGGQNSLSLYESEVGIFSLTATPLASSYFGYTIPAGSSALVGRFIPAYLGSSLTASLTPSCGSFSYQGQWINFGTGPLLAVTGYNRQGGVTGNYDIGEFWRLNTPLRSAYSPVSGRTTLDPRLTESGSTTATAQTDAISGNGTRSYLWNSQQLQWSAAVTPTGEDLPLLSTVNAVRLSVPASSLTDADGVCYRVGGVCSAASLDFGGSELRLGRLRFGNAYGSELQGLAVPFWLESWQSLGGGLNAFQSETADSCSAPLLGTAALTAVAGSGPLLPANIASSSVSAPVAGQGAVNLSAPGVTGSLGVGLSGLNGTALPWLWYDWNGDGSREAGTGLATFGIYAGEKPLIYRRESFR